MKLYNKFKKWYYDKNSICDPYVFNLLIEKLQKLENKKKVKE